jgi:hypothetical protein
MLMISTKHSSIHCTSFVSIIFLDRFCKLPNVSSWKIRLIIIASSSYAFCIREVSAFFGLLFGAPAITLLTIEDLSLWCFSSTRRFDFFIQFIGDLEVAFAFTEGLVTRWLFRGAWEWDGGGNCLHVMQVYLTAYTAACIFIINF